MIEQSIIIAIFYFCDAFVPVIGEKVSQKFEQYRNVDGCHAFGNFSKETNSKSVC